MRKIYSLLLLGGLLFFGVQNVLADDWLKGSWTADWGDGAVKFENNFAKVSLSASTTYSLGIDKSGEWRTADTEITENSSNVDLRNNSGTNMRLTTSTTAGDVSFIITSWNTTGGYWSPILTFMYPGASYSRDMEENAWGTICLPYSISAANVSSAPMEFYSVLGVDSKTAPTKLYLKEETSLEAGKPYIFQATEDDPSVVYGTSAVAAGNEKGLIGTYTPITIDGHNDADKLYVITAAGGVQRAASSCNVGANKAYIKLNDVSEYNPASSAPGVRVVEMNMDTNNATDIKSIEANESAVKFIENGKLFIQKNGVVYDMTGRVVR